MISVMKIFLIASASVLLALLSLPLSNFFIRREYVAPSSDPEFKLVSDTMVKKCADCHSPDMAPRPIYFDFPIAKPIIQADLRKAKSNFVLTRDKLSGAKKFSANELFALNQAMVKGSMPPTRYVALYWDAALSESEQRMFVNYIKKHSAVFDMRSIPEENFFKPDVSRVALGEKLFADKRLSGSGTMSCVSCHKLDDGGSDHASVSLSDSHKSTMYNTPTVFNAAYNYAQNWTASAKNLKEQVQFHVEDERILNARWTTIISRLSQDSSLLSAFNKSYSDGLNASNIADAISSFEQTLLTPGSRFDRYLQGENAALTEEEKAGFEIFKSHDCASCHLGPSLGGQSLEKMGFYRDYFSGSNADKPTNWGRFNVSRNARDRYKFKVPNLRNIELSHPYLHDGSAKKLEDAVRIMSEHQIDKPLTDSEIKLLCKFLKTLTGEYKGKKFLQK